MASIGDSSAAIFDLDGVLVLSEEIHALAYSRLFEREGVLFSVSDFRRIAHGVPRRQVIERVVGDLDEDRLAELMYRKQLLVEELLLKGELRAVEGALEFVAALRDHGVPVAVATVSKMPHAFLRAIGAEQAFDTIVSGNSVAKTKPAPDVFLEAARRLGVLPAECFAIEDSPSGVQAAKAAGMTVVALTTTAAESSLSDADYICSCFREVRQLFGLSSRHREDGPNA